MKAMNGIEACEFVLDCLSSGNPEIKERLEKYVIHRKIFGRAAAKNKFPDCHYIVITDPVLENVWKTLLKTIDSL